MSKITETVYETVKPVADGLGLDIIEIKYERKHDGMNLTVIIDKEGGVGISDCEKLHRALDEPLDTLNPTRDEPYTLNVSSPGLDRPLTLPYDFKKNMNKEITVKLYAPQGGKKQFTGELIGYDEPNFTISVSGENITFDRTKTANIAPVIKF